MTTGWDRRRFLTALSITATGTLAGCQNTDSSSSSAGDGTGTLSQTDTEGEPTGDDESGNSPTVASEDGTETASRTEAVTATETSVDAGEIYREAIEGYGDVEVDVDESASLDEQVQQAMVQGAQQGSFAPERGGGFDHEGTDTHIAAAAAVTQLDGINYSDGDIANPQIVYSAGQTPATHIEYNNPDTGETITHLLTPRGRQTDQEDIEENWTEESNFWNEAPAGSHILDASVYERGFENVDMDSYGKETTNQFSPMIINSHELDVDVTMGSWDAWEAAEEKVTEGLAKDVYDDLTELANQDGINSFAVIYNEAEDSFEAAHVNEDFRDNPFQYLEPVTETATAQ